jgi:membrane-associated phospholipid phosphatase
MMIGAGPRLAWRLCNLNWFPIWLMGAMLTGAVALTSFSIEPVVFGITMAAAFVLALLGYHHLHASSDLVDTKLVFMLVAIAQVISVTAIVGPLSYVVGSFNWPLQDDALLAIDSAMGFDSKAVILFANDHPFLCGVLNFGYDMIKWPLLAIPIVLAKTSRFARLQQFVMSLSVALLITIVISAFIPAIGTYQILGLTAPDVPNVNLAAFLVQQHDIPALREGSLRHLELFKLAGIVAFPSFHAASAVLFAWALWPVRGFGSVALALNALMIASTPILGGHYLIDVIGGMALASACIMTSKRLSKCGGQHNALMAPTLAIPAK